MTKASRADSERLRAYSCSREDCLTFSTSSMPLASTCRTAACSSSMSCVAAATG